MVGKPTKKEKSIISDLESSDFHDVMDFKKLTPEDTSRGELQTRYFKKNTDEGRKMLRKHKRSSGKKRKK